MAPVAFNVVELPLHIATFVPALTTGAAFTVTVVLATPLHPAVVPVTTYTLVTVDVVTGLAQVLQDNPVDGDQE